MLDRVQLRTEPPPSVLIRKLKLNGTVQLDRAYELGTDVYGTWFFTPAGSLHRGEGHGRVGWCQAAQDSNGVGQHAIKLIHAEPRLSVCSWINTPEGVATTVDIAQPPTRTTAGWSYLDLELDPYRGASGQVGVEDWDEFNETVAAGRISAVQAAEAQDECARVVAALQTAVEPYGEVARQVLATAAATEWPPFDGPDLLVWAERNENRSANTMDPRTK